MPDGDFERFLGQFVQYCMDDPNRALGIMPAPVCTVRSVLPKELPVWSI